MSKKKETPIAFNLISRSKLEKFSPSEKLSYIIKEVKKGRILVLEHGLTPMEQTSSQRCVQIRPQVADMGLVS